MLVLVEVGDAPPVLTGAHQKIEDEDEHEHDWGKTLGRVRLRPNRGFPGCPAQRRHPPCTCIRTSSTRTSTIGGRRGEALWRGSVRTGAFRVALPSDVTPHALASKDRGRERERDEHDLEGKGFPSRTSSLFQSCSSSCSCSSSIFEGGRRKRRRKTSTIGKPGSPGSDGASPYLAARFRPVSDQNRERGRARFAEGD